MLYVEEADVDRLQAGADARFLIHGEVLGQAARVVEIDTTRTLRLAIRCLIAVTVVRFSLRPTKDFAAGQGALSCPARLGRRH